MWRTGSENKHRLGNKLVGKKKSSFTSSLLMPEEEEEEAQSQSHPYGHPKSLPMIIKGIFKRYQRWNPVHPTLGTFWGMGIGVGCGVGWGPGFGPEVIGYVGAGCGVGFSVGFTLAGIGVGLPQNGIIKSSRKAIAVSNMYMKSARIIAMAIINGMILDSINFLSPQITALRNHYSQNLGKVCQSANMTIKRVNFTNLRDGLSGSMQSCLRAFKDQQWPRPNGR
ncbi:hypothetical protein LUZ60_010347 [Juncus effusus]|nr:hypothetical protein LUZ60_010347 [Juncus effusus]